MRSHGSVAPMALLAALAVAALWASAPRAFAAPRPAEFAAAAAAASVAMLPAAAGATPLAVVAELPEVADMGSSLNLAALTEVLMCGVVAGIVPVTILGLLVAAWLQFKKGPTLGI